MILKSLTNLYNKNIVLFNIAVSAVLFVIAYVIYFNSLNVPFQFDDPGWVSQNIKVRYLENFWPPGGQRYLGNLSFALNYNYLGEGVFGYHVVNIFIHWLTSVAVYFLIYSLLRVPLIKSYSKTNSLGSIYMVLPIIISLIFLTHPIQTQAVTYIVQRYASLAAFFYVFSILMYVRSRIAWSNGSRNVFYRYFFLGLLSALCAIYTKENALTVFAVIFIVEVIFFGTSKDLLKRQVFVVPFLLVSSVLPAIMFFGRIGSSEGVADTIGSMTTEVPQMERATYLFTSFRVVITYLRLLVLPINQSADYDYVLFNSFFSVQVFLSFIVIVLLFVFAVRCFIKGRSESNPFLLLTSFGVAFFFVSLLVETSVIPIRDVIFEHRLYLPSVGGFVAIASYVAYLLSLNEVTIERLADYGFKFAIVLAVLLSLLTVNRNTVWQSPVSLWSDALNKWPHKARIHNMLGTAYFDEKRYYEAEQEYLNVLVTWPDNFVVLFNMGDVYLALNDKTKAVDYFTKAKKANPRFAETYKRLGYIYGMMGLLNEAIDEFAFVLKKDPMNSYANYSTGVAYEMKGEIDKAKVFFANAYTVNPADINIRQAYDRYFRE